MPLTDGRHNDFFLAGVTQISTLARSFVQPTLRRAFVIGVMLIEASPSRKPAVDNFPAMWPREPRLLAATSWRGMVAKGKAKVSGF